MILKDSMLRNDVRTFIHTPLVNRNMKDVNMEKLPRPNLSGDLVVMSRAIPKCARWGREAARCIISRVRPILTTERRRRRPREGSTSNSIKVI